MSRTATTNGRAPASAAPPRATRPNVNSTKRNQNGKDVEYANSAPWGDVYEAAAYEEEIAREAESLWDAHGAADWRMDRGMFRRLWPLLRRPIHAGHIIATSRATGKPYDSDGIRSAQVLIDRMNNVLTPTWWTEERSYTLDGQLCYVVIKVVDGSGAVLAKGQAYGGMKQANTVGNLYKASFTNAAKLAFAQIGPGHEVYTQAIDYDPDLNPDAAADQATEPTHAAEPAKATLGEADIVTQLLDTYDIACQQGIPEARIKALLVAAGATDTSHIATAIGALAQPAATEFGKAMAALIRAKIKADREEATK